MQDGTPSTGDNLLGMAIDFDVRLGVVDEIDEASVSVHRTEHPERLIRVSCKPAFDVAPTVAIDAVCREWLTNLRYGYREAHLATVGDHAATFDFVTQMAPNGLYVTGRVEVFGRASLGATR